MCSNHEMAKFLPAGRTLLTLETDKSKQTFEVLSGHSYQTHFGDPRTLTLEFPAVRHVYTESTQKQENTITDEEKHQRTLNKHVEKIVQTFRDAERGLLEEADLKRKEEREREARNADRRSKIKQAMNDAFDAGLYDDDIISLLPDGLRGHFDTLQSQLALDADLDNLLVTV